MANERAVVKNADMPKEMLNDALNMCAHATEKYGLEKDIAGYLKKEMDRKYGPTWHCVVGQHYGRCSNIHFHRKSNSHPNKFQVSIINIKPGL
ncbi:hypothetical protein CRM22_005106 [Opisthorchis felineus]|uniref:Dynein light chain n=1 Tax=Opisthorchis felineus TaxID=147828 RepID=A0A4S2LU07_OPIFE|nr:hypothetical protein CRM22_005106 [Opisthorchis felineus]